MPKKEKFHDKRIDSSYKVFCFDFFYDTGNDHFFLLDNNESFPKEFISNGRIYIKVPYWTDMHDVRRKSLRSNPFNRYEFILDKSLYKINKILAFCRWIEDDDGDMFEIDRDMAENLHPSLAIFILGKIDDVIVKHYEGGLTNEEAKELANDCYKYFSALKKKQLGKEGVAVPEPPSIVILFRICEILKCTLDEAKKMSKRDIDSVMVMREQENICSDPSLIGMSPTKNNGKKQTFTQVFSGNGTKRVVR